MAAPDEGPEVDPLARPLPEVRIPLLDDERRRVRIRQLSSLGVLGAAVAVVSAVVWLGAGSSEDGSDVPVELENPALRILADRAVAPPPEVEAEPEVPDAPAPEPEPERSAEDPTATGAATRTRTAFGDARGFRPALLRAGLANAEAAALETALGGVLDFRRCHGSDTLVVERGVDGALLRFEYHDDPTSFVRADRVEDSWHAERIDVPLETRQVVRRGEVRSSLGDAISRANLGRSIAGLFIEVFDGKINFSTQARAGDRFAVVIDEEWLNGEFLRFGQVHGLQYVGERAGELRAYFFQRSGERRGDWYDEDGRAFHGGWLRVPCRYERLSSPFDPRRMHPILRRIVPHNGTDFAASTGTPVWAAADGVITWAGPKGPNGNLVSIRHADGYSSHYAHLHQIQRGIREGVEVEQRQLIGTVGTTGRSTGPHLHFGLKRRGRWVDPMPVINGPGRLLPAGPRGVFRRRARELRALMGESAPAPN